MPLLPALALAALAWDDLTGMKLDAGMVKEAREKEIRYVREKTV